MLFHPMMLHDTHARSYVQHTRNLSVGRTTHDTQEEGDLDLGVVENDRVRDADTRADLHVLAHSHVGSELLQAASAG